MLEEALQKHFGYTSFRTGQKEVIEQLLAGRDVVALLPTGMGKSMCYQLPAYLLDAPVLIVSPLLSLMQDQVDQLKQFGEKRVIALNSFLSAQQKRYALHYLHEYRFIFASPEMLMQPQVKERLRTMKLGLIVADEAHCISQWGFDFRPDYLRLGEIIPTQHKPPILALSATATKTVLQDIEMYLHMQSPFYFLHSVNRPNIHLAKHFFQHKNDKINWILEHVQATEGPGIIYTQSRGKTEAISMALLERGIATAAYHAGKEAEDRQFIQQQFLVGKLDWIVATNAFGMGIHKGNIRQVIHEFMPANIANYMQEIGRAGRDGQPAVASILYAEGDEQFAQFIVTEDLPKAQHIERYATNRDNPLRIVEAGEISETAFRVLHYWMQQESSEAVQQRLQQMEVAKYKAVHEMLQIIQSATCMREQLVHYFGQQLTESMSNCCQNCGLVVDEILLAKQSAEVSELRLTWQERLQYILLAEAQ
ncbi:ATP-dependent DNA helicase [Metasolibacillus meyeri]|uniref:ATP-dependent DNA helicase RecQ n=1 Tax=Metasolibacillus meyeri TaxID=1071052 RepID=A0AAW9NUU9_9BACL|nr:ATP-dependent DNA helicase RecQ [Metasolibacillus meyeri]MEC1179124.1 ATP-dependent DNA helicase [Metasolibacillus meyeri]